MDRVTGVPIVVVKCSKCGSRVDKCDGCGDPISGKFFCQKGTHHYCRLCGD